LIHGSQINPLGDKKTLLSYQKKLECDILISGASLKKEIQKINDKIFINPGSANTNSNSKSDAGVQPGMILLNISEKDGSMMAFQYDFIKSVKMTDITRTYFKDLKGYYIETIADDLEKEAIIEK